MHPSPAIRLSRMASGQARHADRAASLSVADRVTNDFEVHQGEPVMNLFSLYLVGATLLYAGVGIFVMVVAFVILDFLTPGSLWEEIEQKQNVAVAIFAGMIALGLSIIVAAAIVG
jgi:putative membrane protein